MPLYEFRCEQCGWILEAIQAFSDPLPTVCESCGGRLKKLLSSPAVQFKGSGFYLTDYGRGGAAGKKESSTPGESGASPAKSEPSSSGEKASSSGDKGAAASEKGAPPGGTAGKES